MMTSHPLIAPHRRANADAGERNHGTEDSQPLTPYGGEWAHHDGYGPGYWETTPTPRATPAPLPRWLEQARTRNAPTFIPPDVIRARLRIAYPHVRAILHAYRFPPATPPYGEVTP